MPGQGEPLYIDPETDQVISTHSMIKTFRRCPKQADYKYAQRLKPRTVSKPLKRGSWLHTLLEAHFKGEDWKAVHRALSGKFNELFEEEQDHYGDLPKECLQIMKSYLWHYKREAWKIHEVEFTLDTTFPDGSIYRCKIDLLIEDQFGLWLVDHKSTTSLPDRNFRVLDAQSALYIWCAIRNKIPVQGFIWNYIRTKAPTVPAELKKGGISKKKAYDTDYPTFMRAIKEYGLDPDDYSDILNKLKAQRFVHGEPQTSSFFRRDTLEKKPAMLKTVAGEAFKTHKAMNSYFPATVVERVPDKSCSWSCSYVDLCTVELNGSNSAFLRKQRYGVGDPLEYYQDDKDISA